MCDLFKLTFSSIRPQFPYLHGAKLYTNTAANTFTINSCSPNHVKCLSWPQMCGVFDTLNMPKINLQVIYIYNYLPNVDVGCATKMLEFQGEAFFFCWDSK